MLELLNDKSLGINCSAENENGSQNENHSQDGLTKYNNNDIKKLLVNLKVENKRLKQENQRLQEEIQKKTKENKELHNVIEKSITVIEPSITVKDNQNIVIETVNRHEEVIKDILVKIEELEKKIVIEKSFTVIEKNPGYHGFCVSQLPSGYWQAVRRINGRPCCIYIGRNVKLAQEKIEKWLTKHYPNMMEKDT